MIFSLSLRQVLLVNLLFRRNNKSMLRPLAKLIVALNSNLGKKQIAAGFAWGFLLGLIPARNVLWVVLFAVSFLFTHHHASKIFVIAIIKLASQTVAPLVDIVGWEVLHIEALQPLFISLYNMPFVPYTRFNNTLVAGGLVGGAILWLPVFGLVYLMIPLYRNTLAPKIRNSKVVKSINAFPPIAMLKKAVTSVLEVKNRIS